MADDRASAEEELYELACQDMPVTSPEVREALEKFKRAYAHELAEQQRAHQQGLEDAELKRFGWLDHETELRRSAVLEVANLIDPKAHGPVSPE